MKKLTAIAMALIMVLSFSGCSNGGETQQNEAINLTSIQTADYSSQEALISSSENDPGSSSVSEAVRENQSSSASSAADVSSSYTSKTQPAAGTAQNGRTSSSNSKNRSGSKANSKTSSKTNTRSKKTNPGSDKNTNSKANASSTQKSSSSKILVAYFSCTNTTKPLAEYAADSLNADLYRITPAKPYTSADLDYNDDNSRSSIEMNDPDSRPAISGSVKNMAQYDIVFIAYPIWWGEAPRIVSTFIESYDFSGKTIVPFCTSGGSGIGSSAENLEQLTNGAQWTSGRRFGAGTPRSTIVNWINGLELGVTAK